MAIDNPQVTKFSNEKVRTTADAIAALYQTVQAFELEYFNQGIGGIIDAAGASNVIVDGSATDGRTPITGGDVYSIANIAQAIKALLDSSGNIQVVSKVQVNGFK